MAVGESIRHIIKTNEGLLKIAYYTGLYFIMDKLFDKKGVYILCYHRLSDLGPGSCKDPMTVDYRSFQKHLEFLRRKYELISMDMAVELLSRKSRLDRRYVVVTFDDGYRDNYLSGREIFSKYAVKPVIYLTAGRIDQRTWLWHDHIEYMVFECSR